MLATPWDGQDPTGMLMSEKLDGVRAIWTGEEFRSRTGKLFSPPPWFTAGMPTPALDGELWMGRGTLHLMIGTIRASAGDWSRVVYCIFDAPDVPGGLTTRLRAIPKRLPMHCAVIDQTVCRGSDHLGQAYSEAIANGGEGLVLRGANSLYIPKRSSAYLKVRGVDSPDGPRDFE